MKDMKATLIGARYFATGIVTSILLDLFLGVFSIDNPLAVFTGVMSGMVMYASIAAYRAGKHEGQEVVIEVGVNE